MIIKELHLHTTNLKDTASFYRDVLGFDVQMGNSGMICFQAGTTHFTFSGSSIPQPNYHFAFNIPSNQIVDAFHWAKSRNIDILEVAPGQKIADFSSWDAKAFYFLDNNSNIVELIARFDLHEVSDQPFEVKSIISVSEIGIVTAGVSSTCQLLNDRFTLDYFSKQKPMTNFAAVGDDLGLFIIVTENRPWFPTRIHSTKSPLKIVFETKARVNNVLELN